MYRLGTTGRRRRLVIEHGEDGYVALSHLRLSPDLCLALSGDEAFNCAKGVVVARLALTSVWELV